MTGLESLNMKKMQVINKRKIVNDMMLMLFLILDFSYVLFTKDEFSLLVNYVFSIVFFSFILCDAIVMVRSYNKRDFIL